jgi:endonuclease/exonuclease/phosphatase family metal-dependent hydrolase
MNRLRHTFDACGLCWPVAVLILSLAVLATPVPAALARPSCDEVESPGCGPDPDDTESLPVGALGSAHRVPDGVRVRGWAEDPDTSEAISVKATIQPSGSARTLSAGGARGDQHDGRGFDGIVPAQSGTGVCVAALNVGAGADRRLGCVPVPAGSNPVGDLELAERVPGGIRVAGWALDPDTAAAVDLHVYVDGPQFAGAAPAGLDRPQGGWGARYQDYGIAHGFDAVIPVGAEQSMVCVYALNAGPGTMNTQLGCRDPRLAAPTDLRITPAEEWGLTLDWQDNASSENGHRIELQLADGDWTIAREVGPASSPRGSATIAVPSSGHHCVRISATNAAGSSAPTVGCGDTFASPVAYANSLNVATLNIVGNDATATHPNYRLGTFATRLDGLAEAISGFDVVALQEVASVEQVEQLARRTGMYFHDTFLEGQPGCGGCLGGQAILSRWPLSDARQLDGERPGCFMGINCGGPNGIQAATVLAPGHQPLRLVNAHLSVRADEWKAAQAAQIRRELVDPFSGPVLVAGDFNGNDDLVSPKGPLREAHWAPSKVIAHNPKTGRDADHCMDRAADRPAEKEDDRIDHILIRSGAELTYNGVYGKCPVDLKLSDHPRVSARIMVP